MNTCLTACIWCSPSPCSNLHEESGQKAKVWVYQIERRGYIVKCQKKPELLASQQQGHEKEVKPPKSKPGWWCPSDRHFSVCLLILIYVHSPVTEKMIFRFPIRSVWLSFPFSAEGQTPHWGRCPFVLALLKWPLFKKTFFEKVSWLKTF